MGRMTDVEGIVTNGRRSLVPRLKRLDDMPF
jgi:hypothetical protein